MNACRIAVVVSGALALTAGAVMAQKAEPVPAVPDTAAPAGGVKEMKGTACPVLGGPIDRKISADYKGMRYYFCCVGCQGKFKADPEKYTRKMPRE